MRRFIWSVVILLALAVIIRLTIDAFSNWNESYLKQVLVPIASAYLLIFGHQLTAVLLSGVMIISGIALLVWLWLGQFAPAARALRSTNTDIQRIERISNGVEQVRRLDGIFAANPYLLRDWHNYRLMLLAPPEARASMWGAARPERYFRLSSLQRSGVDIALVRSLPNYFVGFGLLFTFMGLVAGLYFASRGLMAADLSAARESLIQLLHTSTFKFSSSVAGLAMSLLFSICGRFMITRLDRQIDDLCHELEEIFSKLPAHEFGIKVGLAEEPRASATGAFRDELPPVKRAR
jgi:hypothetical protein